MMSEETFGNWTDMMNKTLNYYNENAQSFASGTVSVEFTEMQDRFLQKLNPGAYILDFGCCDFICCIFGNNRDF